MVDGKIVSIIFLCFLTIYSKVYEKLDIFKPDFDIKSLDVLTVVNQNSTSCPGTLEKLTTYSYNWRHISGDVIMDQIHIVEEIDLIQVTYSEVLVSDPSIKGIYK